MDETVNIVLRVWTKSNIY